MSVKTAARVWEHSNQSAGDLLLLLAIADHADDDGVCWPGIDRLAFKTRCSSRQVQRNIAKMVRAGELYTRPGGKGPKDTSLYFITAGLDAAGIEAVIYTRFEADRLTAKIAAADILARQTAAQKGDIQGQKRVTSVAKKGDIAMSPEPSIEPSIEPSCICHPNNFEDLLRQAMETYSETARIRLDKIQVQALGSLIESGDFDQARWKQSCLTTKLAGVKPENVQCRIDTYKAGGDYQALFQKRLTGAPDPAPLAAPPLDAAKLAAARALHAEYEAARAETEASVNRIITGGISAAGIDVKKAIRQAVQPNRVRDGPPG